MQLSSILILLTALTAAGVNGADIFRTTENSCGGSKIGCKGVQEGRCCLFSKPVSEVLFTLPADSRGFAYTDNDCEGGSIFFRAAVKGTFCRHFNRNINSAKWEVGAHDKQTTLRSEDVKATCSEPEYASFVKDDGTQREINIPQGMSTKVEEWLEEGMIDLLDQLEDY
ncbi:hypothetical protein H2201_004306 [Coniosporium apollinis]|uniref:Uncharacterized protein n=2 Tax=Coniosporium TaxID=2810619 RepID=A0ABQ9NWE7_9PEZI|nr:hypothetical protein H2199_000072 [Cladosporium sp. JES 115]KAJ9665614.1 hypothetical protein H2201_004306 [Coniosporium apollinis]